MSSTEFLHLPPLMAAIKAGHIETLRSLLEAGHSPNEPQHYQVRIGDWERDAQSTPLELAVLENRMDMVKLLIERGASLRENSDEVLFAALREKDLTMFSFLIEVGAQMDENQSRCSLIC